MAQVIYRDADTNQSYTYAQVKSTAIDFGKGLRSVWEWERGDVLGLFTPNSIDTPAVIWGCLWAGGTISPANPGYTVDELAYQLKDSGAKGIVTQVPFLSVAQKAAQQVGIPEVESSSSVTKGMKVGGLSISLRYAIWQGRIGTGKPGWIPRKT